MLVMNKDKSYEKSRLPHKYGERVQVPEAEECFLNNNMMKEKDCVKIEYNNQQMVEELAELYKRGAMKRG